MIIHYNIERLSLLIKHLYNLTGISLSILDTEYKVLTHCSRPNDFCSLLQSTGNGWEGCRECDNSILNKCRRSRRLEGHICKAGLYDSAMPIIKYDTIVGFVLMGRIRSVDSPENLQHIPDTDADTVLKLKTLYRQIPTMTETQLGALYELLPSILFDSAIQIVYDPLVNEIVACIQADLKAPLSVKYLCQKFHISANHLYSLFRKNLDRTVTEYITDRRMDRARELLLTTNEPVYSVAENVGIDNYTYFCKLFKKRTGYSPARYRKIAIEGHKGK